MEQEIKTVDQLTLETALEKLFYLEARYIPDKMEDRLTEALKIHFSDRFIKYEMNEKEIIVYLHPLNIDPDE